MVSVDFDFELHATNLCIWPNTLTYVQKLFDLKKAYFLRQKRKDHFLHYFRRPFYFLKKIAGVSSGEASFHSGWSHSRHFVSYENN